MPKYKSRPIPTQAPGQGDLVPGHTVYAFWPGLPAVRGTVVEAGRSAVTVDFGNLGRLFGFERRRFTWPRSAGSYQEAGDRTRKGAGLALARLPAR